MLEILYRRASAMHLGERMSMAVAKGAVTGVVGATAMSLSQAIEMRLTRREAKS